MKNSVVLRLAYLSLGVQAFSVLAVPALSLWGMIAGWGLTPKSWPIVIASHLGVIALASLMKIIAGWFTPEGKVR